MSTKELDQDAIAPHIPSAPRLVFGDLELIPHEAEYASFEDGYLPGPLTLWLVPGGEHMQTNELFALAKERGLNCSIILYKGETT